MLLAGDFTPVCTTELGKVAQMQPEFEKRGVKLLGLSTDSVEDHQGWISDIESYSVGTAFIELRRWIVNAYLTRCVIILFRVVIWKVILFVQPSAVKYPILADEDRKLTVELNMLDPDEKGPDGKPLASRALHIIGPDKRVSLVF